MALYTIQWDHPLRGRVQLIGDFDAVSSLAGLLVWVGQKHSVYLTTGGGQLTKSELVQIECERAKEKGVDRIEIYGHDFTPESVPTAATFNVLNAASEEDFHITLIASKNELIVHIPEKTAKLAGLTATDAVVRLELGQFVNAVKTVLTGVSQLQMTVTALECEYHAVSISNGSLVVYPQRRLVHAVAVCVDGAFLAIGADDLRRFLRL